MHIIFQKRKKKKRKQQNWWHGKGCQRFLRKILPDYWQQFIRCNSVFFNEVLKQVQYLRWRFFSKPGGHELYSLKAMADGSHIDLLSFIFLFTINS